MDDPAGKLIFCTHMVDYSKLPTEQPSAVSRDLDRMSSLRLVDLMNREDRKTIRAVQAAKKEIARAVDLIARALSRGGRLFLAGAGTSGRLCVLEAAECPPTFNTQPDQVQAFMAGGPKAVFRSQEGAEDRALESQRLVEKDARRGDVLVGVAASGVTPFTLSALSAARRKGVRTVLVTCNPRTALSHLADVVVSLRTGPELVTGSTRLKAGTATKMVLNMLTTLSMVRTGKVYQHWMVDLQPKSQKLVARGLRLIQHLGRVSEQEAASLFKDARGRVKLAILMARGYSAREARKRLDRAKGFLRKALAVVGPLLLAMDGRAAVKTGLDVLQEQNFSVLAGKVVGLVTNHTGIDRQGKHIVEILSRAPGVRLAAVFSPEHGFSGRVEHGQFVGDSSLEGVPLYSLYGATKRPAPEMLKGLDALVFDMQDIGTRFYTYITTMGYALEEAARAGLEFYVLDRPNPITGTVVEGEVLDPGIRHFTAYYSIPTRHGLTVGEIATLHNDQARLEAKLHVVRMQGWTRGGWQGTGLRFVAPSPNIRSVRAALLYPGIGAFESTNVSVGRGTDRPFEIFGAPWVDGPALARRLEALRLPGVRFKAVRFTPKGKNLYAGQACQGVRVRVTDRNRVRPVDIFVHAACALRDKHRLAFQPRWDEMPFVVGSREFEKWFVAGAPPENLLERIHKSAEEFMEARKPYLLYP
jgi:N-acetylmuramic acid 6-phosphate etherase